MGFTVSESIPAIAVFFQGILSFFSPCVLPLVPLYIGYLAGGAKIVDADGTIRYRHKKVLVNTLFFIIGISFAFFLLGLGFTAAGRFFSGNRVLFARIGGILIILFGLYQLGVFQSFALSRERRIPLKLDKLAMNPLTALLFGFTFSFSWTPCVGPALASVLLMASSANSTAAGFLLIGVYTLGFVLPFLAVGLFTGTLLDFFRTHRRVVQYTVKAGGVLLILMGVMMFTGWMNGFTGYLSGFGAGGSPAGGASSTMPEQESQGEASAVSGQAPEAQNSRPAAPDFTLTDQFGNSHTLSEYRGKVVFLNFWATWCGPCQSEMPDIQALYETYGSNQEDLIVLGVANPRTEEAPYNQDVPEEEIKAFLDEGGYSYPVPMDTTGEVFAAYGITGFPYTFMIDRDGNIIGYVPGAMSGDIMESIVRQSMEEPAP